MAASGSPWRWGYSLLLRHGITILWLCIIISVFWTSYSKYKKEQKHFYLRQILGSGLCLSRGMASVLNVSCFVVMLPMCRSLTSCVRTLCSKTSMKYFCFWIDASKGFHITCAFTIIIASVFHSVAHVVNALNFSRYYNVKYKDINVAGFMGEDPLTMIIETVPGITGVLMVVILCMLSSSSVKYVRSTCYDIFWYTHRLFLVFLLLLLCHPMSGLLKEQNNVLLHIPGCRTDNSTNDPEVGYPEHHHNDPGICAMEPQFVPQSTETWKWITAAISVYVMDLGYRLLRRRPSAHIVSVQSCRGQLMRLKMKKDGFTARPGQFVYLQCSAVSSIEWHPFTISKCPTKSDPTFTVHVRTKGDWSNSLQQHLFAEIGLRLNDMALVRDDFIFHVPSTSALYTELSVDGPFSSCIEDVLRHPVSICVAGGIGITPFAALLSYFRSPAHGQAEEISPDMDLQRSRGFLLVLRPSG